jgi:phosphatidylinositol alpha-mannosyltransferase
MKAGLACPYSLDGPGGVQEHIRDLAEALVGLVHGVSVISPAGDDELPPGHVARPAGRFPSPATARGAHLEVAWPVWVLSGAR